MYERQLRRVVKGDFTGRMLRVGRIYEHPGEGRDRGLDLVELDVERNGRWESFASVPRQEVERITEPVEPKGGFWQVGTGWGAPVDYGEHILAALEPEGFRVAARAGRTVYVESQKYRTFAITDNGGELNVEMVNVWPYPHSVPYTADATIVDPLTMVYRIRATIRGEAIDYAFRVGEPVG